MKILRTLTAALAAGSFCILAMGLPVGARAQGLPATVHGHVTNPLGIPLTNGDVRFTTGKDPNTTKNFDFDFALDAQGNYTGKIDRPGTYVGVVFQGTNHVDFSEPTAIASGDNKTIDFDMTRKEYLDKMTPAEKQQLEDYKKNAAATIANNVKVANLNSMLTQARADTTAGNFDAAIKAMTDATTAKPDEAVLWEALGDAQLGQANAAQKASATDPTLHDKFGAAVISYQKAVTLESAKAKPRLDVIAGTDNQMGQAYGREGKTKEASDAYEAAAKADPTKAAMYYFNEAATLFNVNDSDGAAAAADKSIAADPTKAEAYYIKAEGLAPKITGPVNGKFVAPPGFVEACQKYLQLQPNGPHAGDVQEMLTALGEKVETSYKAPKGK